MANALSLVAGGAVPAQLRAAEIPRTGPTVPWVGLRARPSGLGERWRLPNPPQPTLCELFAAHPRDGGWAGFLVAQLGAQLEAAKPLLWVQQRMAILESGRVHPPGLRGLDIIHVEARDAREALWAMEEGLRCSGLSAVVGEIWGDPLALDFTATRRLAVAAERNGVAAFLIRLGGHASLSGARMRWRLASLPSAANPLDPRAPGAAAWDAELFRARGHPPGRWSIAHDGTPSKYYFDGTHGAAGAFHLVAESPGRALGEEQRLTA